MNQVKALFDAGKLEEATQALLAEVKANPSDPARRTFLFELSCFGGDWARAEKQLDVIGHQSAEAELGVMVYRANIAAEQERERVFRDGVQPHFLREPPRYIDLHVQAINQLRAGELEAARATLDRAEEERPAFSGKSDGNEFGDFRDYDDFVAPVLELIVKDKYVWMPFEQIRRFEISPPRQLRDLLWASAQIEALDGTVGQVYVPALYAGTAQHSNDQVKLGRLTDWNQIGEDLYRTVGLRLFRIEEEEKSLFEAKTVEFDAVPQQVQGAPS